MVARLTAPGTIFVGIGGWDYDPWRGSFFPDGLPKAKQLEFASRQLTAIEINATFYKLRKPDLFARWRDAVPEGFRFAIKGSLYCCNRKVLGEAGEGVERFLGQGLIELGEKLGPILWQFAATKRFDPDDIAAFLDLLPDAMGGVRLRHALEPWHESFRTPAFYDLARRKNAAIVFADADDYPSFDERTADFSYARLQRARAEEPTGYDVECLQRWADLARSWAADGEVYMFMINGAKERAPAAAQALIARL